MDLERSHRCYSLTATEWICQDTEVAPALLENLVDPGRQLVIRAITPVDYLQETSDVPALEGNDGSQWPSGSLGFGPEELKRVPLPLIRRLCVAAELAYSNPRDVVMHPRAVLADQSEGFPVYIEPTSPSIDAVAYMWLSTENGELKISFRGSGSVWDIVSSSDLAVLKS